MLKIGLTGGIGCGKTTVSALFAAYGIPVIDADTIAHSLLERESPALHQLMLCFGPGIINNDGTANRAALRDLVFSDQRKRLQLEAILHPLIYQEMQRRLDTLRTSYALLCIPLLLETQKQRFVDRILVVDCPESLQIERVTERNKLPKTTVAAIMRAQVTRQQRLAAADDIIDNSGSLTGLEQQVDKLHNLYLTLSTPMRNAYR